MLETWLVIFLYVADPFEHIMPLETTQIWHDNYFRYSDFYVLVVLAGFSISLINATVV